MSSRLEKRAERRKAIAENARMYRQYSKTSVTGLEASLSVVFAVVAGYFADRYFETTPKLTLVGLFIGVIAGARILYFMSKKYQAQLEAEDEKDAAKEAAEKASSAL